MVAGAGPCLLAVVVVAGHSWNRHDIVHNLKMIERGHTKMVQMWSSYKNPAPSDRC